ncbi:Non-specific serine/threonine protein kinase [Mycena chlorophos]|uniref:Non-specific serine/threonine protein kinase n=1 Tax=Mycena chlorophos TaxID=658473 RepID=A0A8H6SNX8_MYCCL|nr:Non-specific serine/threonine protein kinase [Mycena chlorophos]
MLLLDLPTELHLLVAESITHETLLDPRNRLPEHSSMNQYFIIPIDRTPEVSPDLAALSAFSRTCTELYRTLRNTLFSVCLSHDKLTRLKLLYAVESDQEWLLDRLVATGDHKVPLDAEYVFDEHKRTPLHIAARAGQHAMAVKLLALLGDSASRCAYTRLRDQMTTPLDLSSARGHLDLVQLLGTILPDAETLREEPNARQKYLDSALFRAAAGSAFASSGFEQVDVVDRLLQLGANPRVRWAVLGALHAQNTSIVQRLLAAGASPNAVNPQFVGGPQDPLHLAISHFDCASVEVLLEGGANVNSRMLDGPTPLRRAIQDTRVPLEIVRSLLQHGADFTVGYTVDHTILHHLFQVRKELVVARVALLLEFGAGSLLEAGEETPLDVAMGANMVDVVRICVPHIQDEAVSARVKEWLLARPA